MSLGVYIYGAGGHARVVLEILKTRDESCLGFVDDSEEKHGELIHGFPVYWSQHFFNQETLQESQWIVGVGDNQIRRKLVHFLEKRGIRFATAIHPSAQISDSAVIAEGSVVTANAVINADTRIGRHVIINTGSTIDHDCKIDDFCHVAPGCSLCGNVHLEQSVFLGVGSCAVPSTRVGEYSVCGAGSVIVCSLPSHSVAYGCPAKVVRQLDKK